MKLSFTEQIADEPFNGTVNEVTTNVRHFDGEVTAQPEIGDLLVSLEHVVLFGVGATGQHQAKAGRAVRPIQIWIDGARLVHSLRNGCVNHL
jgi:hypothetical protein